MAAAWGHTCDQATTAPQASAHRGSGPEAQALSTALRLDPAASDADIGQPVTLHLLIDEALDLGSFEFTLTYDATRLAISADNVVLGELLGSTGRSATVIGPQIKVENGVGPLRFGAYTLGASPAGPNGSGSLAEITFTPLAAGTSEITFTAAQVTDTTGQSVDNLALRGATLRIAPGGPVSLPFVER